MFHCADAHMVEEKTIAYGGSSSGSFHQIFLQHAGNVCYVFLHPYLIWLLIYNSLIIQTGARQPCHGFKSLLYPAVLSEPVSFFFCCFYRSTAKMLFAGKSDRRQSPGNVNYLFRASGNSAWPGQRLEKACAAVLRESEQLHGPGNALANAVMERWSECFRGNIKQRRQGDFHLVGAQTWPHVCVCVCVDASSKPGFIAVPQKQIWPSEQGSQQQQQHRSGLAGCGQRREGCAGKDAELNPTHDKTIF